MPELAFCLVDVYPYRCAGEQPEFLLLRRAPDVCYGGQWRWWVARSKGERPRGKPPSAQQRLLILTDRLLHEGVPPEL